MAQTEQATSSSSGFKATGFAHITVPVRDLDEAKRFYTQVLGGTLIHERPAFAGVDIAGLHSGFSQQERGWTAHDAEFPHIAFFVSGEDFLSVKEHLEAHGVSTHQPWTRFGSEVQMYFRDPSGNLLEIQAQTGFKGAEDLPRTGDYAPPVADLIYGWKG
jgi:catechol 2,3-dioxygenase-like lactoylglutathione lyase family enzyme